MFRGRPTGHDNYFENKRGFSPTSLAIVSAVLLIILIINGLLEINRTRKGFYLLLEREAIVLLQHYEKNIQEVLASLQVLEDLLFCAGQIPLDPATGCLVAGDIKAQTERALENVKAILEDQGLPFGNVVKTTVFLTDLPDFAAMNEVYARYFKMDFPARSTIQVAGCPRVPTWKSKSLPVIKRALKGRDTSTESAAHVRHRLSAHRPCGRITAVAGAVVPSAGQRGGPEGNR